MPAVNTKIANQFYSNKIQTLKRTRDVFTAGKKTLKINKYIDLSFIHPKTHDLITTISFYLIDNLTTSYLASHYLLRKLGCTFPSIPPKYKDKMEHKPEIDTRFGSCNNWDKSRLRVPYPPIKQSTPYTHKSNDKTQNSKHNVLNNQYKHKDKHLSKYKRIQCYKIIHESDDPLPPMTPYDEYIKLCTKGTPHPKLYQINKITYIKSNNKLYIIINYTTLSQLQHINESI